MTEHYNPMVRRMRDRASSKTSKAYKYAPKQEKALAARAQSWRVPGSGSGRKKGDVQVKDIARIECKATSRKSFSVTREMIEKIENGAGATGELPVIQIDFLDEDGELSHSCAVVPIYALQRLIADAE